MRVNPETSVDGIANVTYKISGDGSVFQLTTWLAQSFSTVERSVQFYDFLVEFTVAQSWFHVLFVRACSVVANEVPYCPFGRIGRADDVDAI